MKEEVIHDRTTDDQKDLSKVVAEYHEHTSTHPKETLRFAIMIQGHGIDGGMHVCQLFAGPPEELIAAFLEVFERLSEKNPELAFIMAGRCAHVIQKHPEKMLELLAMAKEVTTDGKLH